MVAQQRELQFALQEVQEEVEEEIQLQILLLHLEQVTEEEGVLMEGLIHFNLLQYQEQLTLEEEEVEAELIQDFLLMEDLEDQV